MTRPLVIAHHLVWTAYGWWLPNDPRGSGSRNVAAAAIAHLGDVHFGRRESQPSSRTIQHFYQHAGEVLKFPLLTLDSKSILVVADALAKTIDQHRYTCYACAIMPDHVHVVVRKHKHHAETMIEHFQNESRLRLSRADLRSRDHPVWTQGGWKVFLDHPERVRRTICYVENNPEEIGLGRQHWPFVTEYDGWPLHPGNKPEVTLRPTPETTPPLKKPLAA